MKKGIIGIIVIAIVAVGGYIVYSHTTTQKISPISTTNTGSDGKTSDGKNLSSTNEKQVQKEVSSSSQNGVNFTKSDMSNYYKLSQNVGDIGLPSASMTTNLDAYKTIGGVNYYSTYSYDTRAAYQNDTSKPVEGNYSHMINSKIISLDGKTVSDSAFKTIDSSKMSQKDIVTQVYKIAAMYVEGYTANDPTLVVSANDNYEGNLNVIPQMKVNLDNFKDSKKGKLYEVTASLNGYETPIYVGLDGYIYVSSEQDFNQLFFPNKVS
ncbi:MAG: hypothetical protein ACRC6T_08560 [Sarcina sp.]